MRAVLVLGLGLSTLALAQQTPRVRLTYVRESDACPPQSTLEAAVSARLGYSPFDVHALRLVMVRVGPDTNGLTGSIELFDETGARAGKRSFQSPTRNCAELASTIELALAITVDPQTLVEPRPSPPQVVTPTPAVVAAPVIPPAQPADEPLHFSVGILGAPMVGLSPLLTGTFGVQAALRWRALEVGVEGRADLPSRVPVGTGSVTSNVLAGTLDVCGVYRWLGACALATVGALQITGEVVEPATRITTLLVLAGARFRARFELGAGFALQPFLDLEAVLTRTAIYSGNELVWVTFPVAGKLGLALCFQVF